MNCEYHSQQIKYFCAAEACYYLPLCDQCCNEHKQAHNKLETIPLKKAYLMAESNIRRQQTQIERLIAPFRNRQFMAKEIAKQKEDLQKQKQRLIKIITQKIDAEIRLLSSSNQTQLSREETNLKKSLQLKSQEISTFGCPHFYKKASILRKALNYQMTNFLQEMVTKNNQNLMKVHSLLNNSNRFKVFQNIHHQILISPLQLREKTQQKTKQVKRIMNQSPLYFLIDQNMGTCRLLYTLQPQQKKMFIYNIDQENWSTSHTSLQIYKQGTAVHDQKYNRYFWIGGVGTADKNIRQSSGSYPRGRRNSGNYEQGNSIQISDRILVFQPENGENQWRYLNCRLNVPRSSCHAVIVQDKQNSGNYGIVVAGGIGQNGQILKSSQFIDLNNQTVTPFYETNFGAFSGTLVSFSKSNVLRIGGLYKNKSDYSIVEVVERLDCADWFRNGTIPKWSYVQLIVPQFDRTQTPNLFHANQAAVQINPNEIFVFGGLTSDNKGVVQSYIIGVEQFNVQSRGINLNYSSMRGSSKQNMVKQLKFTVRWVNQKPLISGDDFARQTASIWKGRLHILQNMGLNEYSSYQKRLLEFNMHEWSQIQQVLPE